MKIREGGGFFGGGISIYDLIFRIFFYYCDSCLTYALLFYVIVNSNNNYQIRCLYANYQDILLLFV